MPVTRLALTLLVAALAACGGGGGGGSRSASPFPIATDLSSGGGVAAAWGGDRYLVTFGDDTSRGGSDVFGVRLSKDGEVLDSAPFLLSDFGSSPFLIPGALYSPGGIAFASEFGVFLFGTGTVGLGPPGQVVGFVSVPRDGPPGLPATGIDEQASFSMAQTSLRSPIAVTTNGSDFLGAYQRILTLVGAFSVSQVLGQIVAVTEAGVRAQEAGPFSGIVPPVGGMITSGSPPGVAIAREDTLVAWVEESAREDSPGEVSTAVKGVLLRPESATFVSLADTEAGSYGVAVAGDEESFLVVWTATTAADPSTVSELRALRFTRGGSPEPPGGFLIAGGGSAKQLGGASYADGVFLVAWLESGVLRGARLGRTGDDADVFTIDPGPDADVALATDGKRFLAAFERVNGTTSSDVLGTFVRARP